MFLRRVIGRPLLQELVLKIILELMRCLEIIAPAATLPVVIAM